MDILDELMGSWMLCVKEELAEHGITGQLNVEFIEDEPDECDCDCCNCDCHDEPVDRIDKLYESLYGLNQEIKEEENIGDEYRLAVEVADFYCGLIDCGLSVEEAMELTKYRTHSL